MKPRRTVPHIPSPDHPGTSCGGLEDAPFSYRTTDQETVLISWRGKQVMALKGAKARSFLMRTTTADLHDQQLVMARITGNFKRGNERTP